MKIAIYGDSYGNCFLTNFKGDEVDRGKAWVEILADRHQVKNFSVAGSSLFYSYDLFLQHNQNFDYNIFLVTEPNRITLPDEYEFPLSKHAGISTINGFKRTNNIKNNNIITMVESYYSLIHNQKVTDTFHNLMLDNIHRINQNTLIIPCFNDSVPGEYYTLNSISGYEWSDSVILKTLRNNKFFNWAPIEEGNTRWTYNEYKKCHLTEENNIILADLISNAIDNRQYKIDLNLDQFKKMSKDIEYYYMYIDLNQVYSERRLNGELYSLYNKLISGKSD